MTRTMIRRLAVVLVMLLAACAGTGNLVPGQSTEADVQAALGKPAEERERAGETVYYYPQLPWGYRTDAARIGGDGRLIALEQRLTDENIAKIVKGQKTGAEV